MPKRKALSDTMTAARWAALYESAAERASKGEREIKRMQERIRQLEQEVQDWKAKYHSLMPLSPPAGAAAGSR